MFESFDRICIINLPHRRDRRRQMQGELRRVGLAADPRVAFVRGVRPADKGDFMSVGARGVYLSQRAILDEAANRNQSVLILEDDCDFTSLAESYAATEEWDIFYGGYEASIPADLHNSDIIGAHMMGFTARGAGLVSEYLHNLDYKGEHPPIDGAYVWFRRAHPEVPTHFAQPPIAYQRPSRTDIAPLAFYDRWPGIRRLAQSARGLKRLFNNRRAGARRANA